MITPGPWRRGQEGNLRIYGPNGTEHAGLICEVAGRRDGSSVDNLKAIALVPEMIEMIKRLLTAMELGVYPDTQHRTKMDARALLARVAETSKTGETQ